MHKRGLQEVLGVVTFLASLIFSTVAVQAQSADPQNPCGLVSEAEMVAVLAEPLVGPAFRENDGSPDPAGKTCRYEASKYRSIAVTVDWEDGGRGRGGL